jgi:hypothetical protein
MNQLAKTLVTLAAMYSGSVYAGSIYLVVPDMPEIDSPANESTDTSTTPIVSGSSPSATVSYDDTTDVPVNLESAEWLFYKPVDGMQLLGSAVIYGSELYTGPEISIPTPIEFSIDGIAVSKITITNYGRVGLYSEGNIPLADAKVSPDSRNMIKLGGAELIQLNIIGNRYITVTWPFENSTDDPLEWAGTFQVVIDTQAPAIGIHLESFTSADFSSSFFDKTAASMQCSMRINSASIYDFFSLSYLADSWGHTTYNCYNANGALANSFYTAPSFLITSAPEIKRIIAPSNPYTLDESDKLAPLTTYEAIMRYEVSDSSDPELISYSPWAKAVSFATGLDSNYAISISGTPTFEPAVTETLTFSLENTGSDAGSPKITVSLPFSIFSGIDSVGGGDVEQALNTRVVGGSGSCAVEVGVSEPTIVSCTANELAAGATLSMSVDVTFATESTQTIEYGVCETLTDDCDSLTLESVTFSVSAAEETTGNNEEQSPDNTVGSSSGNGADNSGSGSSSGGAFGALILALCSGLLFTRRRKLN